MQSGSVLLSFLPNAVRQRLLRAQGRRGADISAPEQEDFEAALAFVDISGFSRLSEVRHAAVSWPSGVLPPHPWRRGRSAHD